MTLTPAEIHTNDSETVRRESERARIKQAFKDKARKEGIDPDNFKIDVDRTGGGFSICLTPKRVKP